MMQKTLNFIALAAACLIASAADADVPGSHESRAARLLEILVGSWCFELRAADDPDNVLTGGRRQFTEHEFDYALSWREHIDGTNLVVIGVIGYRPSTDSFYEFGHVSNGVAEFTRGEWHEDGNGLVFKAPGDTGQTELRWRGVDSFEYLRFETEGEETQARWRATFNRCES